MKEPQYIVLDVLIPDCLTKKLSETSTHIYRDKNGNIINYIKCFPAGSD